MTRKLLLLDACCAINLLASGRADEILAAVPHDAAVARLVLEDEVLHIRPEDEEGTGPGPGAVVQTSLRPLADRRLLEVLDLASQAESATYVDLALELDDGEAMTGALAIHRGALLATDDKKAIRVMGKLLPESSIVRTSELLKGWADRALPKGRLREALRNIERRASFRPPRNDPLREWWELAVTEE